jgi:hypothetical protein
MGRKRKNRKQFPDPGFRDCIVIVMKNMTGAFNAHALGKVGKGTTDCHFAQGLMLT